MSPVTSGGARAAGKNVMSGSKRPGERVEIDLG